MPGFGEEALPTVAPDPALSDTTFTTSETPGSSWEPNAVAPDPALSDTTFTTSEIPGSSWEPNAVAPDPALSDTTFTTSETPGSSWEPNAVAPDPALSDTTFTTSEIPGSSWEPNAVAPDPALSDTTFTTSETPGSSWEPNAVAPDPALSDTTFTTSEIPGSSWEPNAVAPDPALSDTTFTTSETPGSSWEPNAVAPDPALSDTTFTTSEIPGSSWEPNAVAPDPALSDTTFTTSEIPGSDPVAEQLGSQLEPFTSRLPEANRGNLVEVYTNIARFLVDDARVMGRLGELDIASGDALNGAADPDDSHKRFGEFLNEFERTQGFNRAATEDEGRQPAIGGQEDQNADAAATLLNFVQPQSFLDDLIKRGYQWNDPGAGVGHGEFTHRIQWYLIAKEIEAGGIDTHGLHLVDDVYKGLATPGILSREGVGQSLWDVLVDRQKKPGSSGAAEASVWPETMYSDDDAQTPGIGNSARSPEFLNTWMISRFPNLGKFIKEQTKAREKQEDQYEEIRNQLARRYFPDNQGQGNRDQLNEYVERTGAAMSNIFRVPRPGYGQGDEPDRYTPDPYQQGSGQEPQPDPGSSEQGTQPDYL